MIRTFLLPTLLALALLACKADPKPAANAADQQDPELARLNALLAKDPKNDSLLYYRARAFYKLDAFDEALVDASHAIQLDSTRPAYYHLLADILIDYARPNDSRRAIEVLKKAAQKFPDRIPTLLKLSEFQLIVQQHADALSTLDHILQRDPQNAEAFFMAGRVALDKGDTTNAVASLQKSVRLDENNTDAWMFLGRIFTNRNNPVALQYFDNALRVDSTNLAALEFKGVFYKRTGQFDKAFQVYRDLVVRDPEYSDAYFDMGMIYLELDSLSLAYTNFDIAIKADPLFIRAYYYRGVTSEEMGNPEAALADYKQANGMAPDFPEAKEAVARLSKK